MSDLPPRPTQTDLPPETGDERDERLKAIMKAFPYPPTPDVAGSVRRRLATPTRPLRAQRRRRLLVWAALLLLISLCALTVPEVRAAIEQFIRVGVIRIFVGPPTETPTPLPSPAHGTPTPTPAPSVTALKSIMDLAGQTTLELARRRVTYPLRLPGYPPDLGSPDGVFVQNVGGPLAVFVWLNPDNTVRLSLHELGPSTEPFAEKSQPRIIQRVTVNGQPGVWIEGEHVLQYSRGGRTEMGIHRLVDGHVLVWEENDITYRIETQLPLEEALKVAASLRE